MSVEKMPENNIVVGDMVTLNSGGPMMTVGRIFEGQALCYWFATPNEKEISYCEVPVQALLPR